MSGRDCRRLTARADTVSHETKRNQISRIVVGAVAAGCKHIMIPLEPRRLAIGAVEHMNIGADIEEIRTPITHTAEDTRACVEAMRKRGCELLIILGGDGTNRIVTKAWPDVLMMPLSTGTNNVFPLWIEPTVAGMAAGLVASALVSREQAARRAKIIEVNINDEPPDIALVDALFLQGDRIGNLGPFEPELMTTMLLTRAEPDAVGMSPLGGLLCPSGFDDDFGVEVNFCSHEQGGKLLRAPVSPGLFRTAHIRSAGPVELGKAVTVTGEGILAFDGDRERKLADGQQAKLTVTRNGPWVINPRATLRVAAQQELLVDLPHWVDPFDGAMGSICC